MRGSAHGTRRSWNLFGCALVCALVFASSCKTEVTERYRVSGYVRDLATNDGISNVTVTFTSDTLYTSDTRTAGNGAYELNVESDVRFGQIRAEREGFTTDQRTVYFDSTDRRIDLGLREVTPEP